MNQHTQNLAARNKFFRVSRQVISAMCIALCASPFAMTPTDREIGESLNTAMHDVLAHNDLADLEALSKILGLRFRVKSVDRFDDDERARYEMIALSNPHTMFASGLRYGALIDKSARQSQISLAFYPRACPDVRAWARSWGLDSSSGGMTDAAGSYDSIDPSERGSIAVRVTRYTGGACEFSLTQNQAKVVAYPVPGIAVRDSGLALARRAVDLVAFGDLRDAASTANILKAEFFFPETRAPLERSTKEWSVYLTHVIPNIDPRDFRYFANDTGWKRQPSSIIALPKELAERSVDLFFTVDTGLVCFSASQIAEELSKRAIAHSEKFLNEGVKLFTARGENEISLSATVVEGCVKGLHFHQITDAKHSLLANVDFPVAGSFAPLARKLNARSTSKLAAIVERTKSVNLSEVTIVQRRQEKMSGALQDSTAKLATLLKEALIGMGIKPEVITIIKTEYKNGFGQPGVTVKPIAL